MTTVIIDSVTSVTEGLQVNWSGTDLSGRYFVVFVNSWPVPSMATATALPVGIPQQISSPYTYTVTSYFTDPLNSGATAPLSSDTTYTITVFAYSASDVNTYLVNSIDGTGTFQASNNNNNNNNNNGAVCFLGNAPVLTPAGWARIDSLAVGDLVCTADGRDVAVTRVKHQRIERPSAAVNPYVIPAGLFGATENLPISPRHCVAVPGRGMVEAQYLGLKQMPMRATFDYYNLELPEWDNMIVAGVEVESLAPKKHVVMTVAQMATLIAALPAERRAAALSKVTALADGRVVVQMNRKERRGATQH